MNPSVGVKRQRCQFLVTPTADKGRMAMVAFIGLFAVGFTQYGLVVAFHRLAIIGVQVSADTVSLCVVARATAWRFVFRRSMALLSTGGFFGFVFALFALTFSFSRLVLALPAFTFSLACTPLALTFGLFGFVFTLFAFAFSLLGFILTLPAFALG